MEGDEEEQGGSGPVLPGKVNESKDFFELLQNCHL